MKNSLLKKAIKTAALITAAIVVCGLFACNEPEQVVDTDEPTADFSPDQSVRVTSVAFTVIDESSRAEYEKLPLTEVLENALASTVALTVQTESATAITSGVAVACSTDGQDTYIAATHQSVAGAKSVVARYENGGETLTFSTDDGTLKPVGSDPQTDICVMRVSGKLPIVATYDDEFYVGESVAAAGNLLADSTLLSTRGVLSNVNYLFNAGEGKTSRYLLTDAYVKPSGSGGLFLERGGFFAGLITSLSDFKQTQICAVIPAPVVKEVCAAIIQNGYVPGRYKLGVSVTDNRYSWGVTTGVEVTEVSQDGSLYAGGEGLKVGDILRAVTINGTTYVINRAENFLYYLYGENIGVGDVLTFSIERGKTQLTLAITVVQYNYFDEN